MANLRWRHGPWGFGGEEKRKHTSVCVCVCMHTCAHVHERENERQIRANINPFHSKTEKSIRKKHFTVATEEDSFELRNPLSHSKLSLWSVYNCHC